MNSTIAADPNHVRVADETKVDATRLAVERTRLAFERTTMAWVRTATSLITFGFSVYKFFQIGAKQEAPDRLIGPREFALMMISMGIISLVLATIQHWHSMRSLRAHAHGMHIPRSLAVIVGGLMSILGLLALTAVFLKR
jgi:putative membrane protein